MRWMRANAVINECNLACHLTLSTIRERRGETFDLPARTEREGTSLAGASSRQSMVASLEIGYVLDIDNESQGKSMAVS